MCPGTVLLVLLLQPQVEETMSSYTARAAERMRRQRLAALP
jgi:hypothetical protein